MSPRLVAPLAVAALVAGATTAASMSWPVLPEEPRPGRVTTAPVVERSLVCPHVSGAGGLVSTRASLAALPGSPGRGRAAMTGLRGSFPARLPVLTAAGGSRVSDVTAAGGPVRMDASGTLAAGVAAEQVTRSESGRGRGLAESRCAATAPDTWFVGGSTTVGASASLELVNPDGVAATATVSLLTATGRVAPRAAQGIQVPPRGSIRLALESLAPGTPALATHVAVTGGRVAASILDSRGRATLPLGVDFVPPTAAPAGRAVVPGLLAGSGPRLLVLGVPGPDDATVALRVVTTEGSFVPAALHAVRVRAGTVATVNLATVLGARPAAVAVTSDVPVVAGGFSGSSDPYTHEADFGWSPATPPLTGPALVPDNRVRGPLHSVLVLTAPGAAASLSLTALGAGSGPTAPVRVQVPAGRTVALPLPALVPSGDFALVVTPAPGSGPVYGSRELSERWSIGTWLSQLSLERTEAMVTVPTVTEDAGAGSP